MNVELVAEYGRPERLPNREDGSAVFGHPSEESARAFADANGEFGSVDFHDGRWLSIVDVPKMAAQIHKQLGYSSL